MNQCGLVLADKVMQNLRHDCMKLAWATLGSNVVKLFREAHHIKEGGGLLRGVGKGAGGARGGCRW